MNLRTGDILIWRATSKYDLLGENTIMLKGYHTGLILCGKRFGKYSECGKSPSNIYVTYYVHYIYPIEEVVGDIWFNPNGASLHVVHRTNGRDIPEKEMENVLFDYINLPTVNPIRTGHLAIAAYFKMGETIETIPDGHRYHMCSTLNGHVLFQLGILHSDAVITNLLPVDFHNCRFYQKDHYKIVEIFDKATYTYDWLFLGMMHRLGMLNFKPMTNKKVCKIMGTYDYPRHSDTKRQVRKKKVS